MPKSLDISNNKEDPSVIGAINLFVVAKACKTCMAKDEKNKVYLRETVDMMIASGVPFSETAKWLGTRFGITILPDALSRHIRDHSPYVKRVDSKALNSMQRETKTLPAAVRQADIAVFRDVPTDTYQALQDVVNIGAEKVRSGEIVVDDNLYIKALQTQSKMKQGIGYEKVIKAMQKARFESTVDKGEVLQGDSNAE